MRIGAALLALASIAWAGDEFTIPTLREGSGYDSPDLKYRVVGVEEREAKRLVWVVADPEVVLNQKAANAIIKDIRRRVPDFTTVMFYSSVRDKPTFPAFRITDDIAVYLVKDNKTHYGTAAKHLYGGWAHGPN
jgi:hypothetical protein